MTECDCPRREIAPDPPKLNKSVELYTKNELKEIILEHYKSSTFNTCKHQQLPLMQGPPLELHVDQRVKPYVCHTPAPVPAHWENKVKADLEYVEVCILELLPDLLSLVTLCATDGTTGYLILRDSFFPLPDIFLLMDMFYHCVLGCGKL